jgi:mannose-6-phosphate isomerase-like protein (cupin superfamily)
MRRTLIFFCVASATSTVLSAQTPQPQPGTTKPAPRPAVRAAPRPATLVIQVTDALGAPLADTHVTSSGTLQREGATGADGSIRFTNLRAGNYRLRFTREGVITLERDVTLRAGEAATVEVSLSPAPAPRAPEPAPPVAPPPPPTPSLPSSGDPKVIPVPLFLEKNFIGGREGRKDSLLGCTPTATATLHQLRDSWVSHSHDDADEWIYVVAGEGTLRMSAGDQRLQAGTFILVPHGMAHSFVPQGRNPLIVTAVLSGPACKG